MAISMGCYMYVLLTYRSILYFINYKVKAILIFIKCLQIKMTQRIEQKITETKEGDHRKLHLSERIANAKALIKHAYILEIIYRMYKYCIIFMNSRSYCILKYFFRCHGIGTFNSICVAEYILHKFVCTTGVRF